MSYLDYKRRIEFGTDEYDVIDAFAGELGIAWFASPWDEPSVEFLARYDPPCIKIASASLTDDPLLSAVAAQGTAVMLSTGMSTMEEIDRAVGLLPADRLLLAHATSTYPCPPEELNLRMIPQLAERFGVPVGYSGHETGLQTTLAAVVLGATFIERHVTLDRAMWGSDHAASVEPSGLQRLVRDVRVIESALGDGHKRVYDSEVAQKAKLRRT
jgi:N-acetylneuraminate synthase